MEAQTSESEASKLGRPTAYEPEFCQKAANLCIAGATDFEVAEALGVCVRTIYRWKAEYPDFCHALRLGKELADDRVEASLYHRSVGYSYPAVKIMQNDGDPVLVPFTEHVPPDIGAITLWLINRRGDKWRAKQTLEMTGPGGGPIQHEDTRDRNLSAIEALSARLPGPAPGAPAAAAEVGGSGAPDDGGGA
jgi:hypothetical protein